MLWETIEKLSAIPGVSGCEDRVRAELIRLIEGRCDYEVDPLGNLLAFKRGRRRPAKKLLFSAHMDEVGLIVTYAGEDGLLRFSPVGGIDRRILPGKSVLIGETFGVIGCKPVHMKNPDERDRAPELDSLYIDVGARDQKEALSLVKLGDRAVFGARYAAFGDGFVRGRALDDRVGCALLVELIQSELEYDTHFAFTVQEETGTTGGRTAGAQVLPDVAVAVETTTACDIPDVPPEKVVCALRGGPVVSFMDRGTVYDMALYRQALRTAEERGITCQVKAGIYGGNEARSLQVAGPGVRVLAVSVPCRYLHTPSCVVHRSDVEETGRLLAALVEAFAG